MKKKVTKVLKTLDKEEYYRALLEKKRKRDERKRQIRRLLKLIFHHTGLHFTSLVDTARIDDELHRIFECRVCGKEFIDSEGTFILAPIFLIFPIALLFAGVSFQFKELTYCGLAVLFYFLTDFSLNLFSGE